MSEVMDVVGFEHVDLMDIDPTVKKIEPGFYNLQVLSAKIENIVYKTGDRAGQEGQMIKLRLAVVDSQDYSGRNLFETLWPGNFCFKALRRLSDATGVPPSSVPEFIENLNTVKPRFRTKIDIKDRQVRGEMQADNVVNWFEVQAAA